MMMAAVVGFVGCLCGCWQKKPLVICKAAQENLLRSFPLCKADGKSGGVYLI